jgi:hypothetical protein
MSFRNPVTAYRAAANLGHKGQFSRDKAQFLHLLNPPPDRPNAPGTLKVQILELLAAELCISKESKVVACAATPFVRKAARNSIVGDTQRCCEVRLFANMAILPSAGLPGGG